MRPTAMGHQQQQQGTARTPDLPLSAEGRKAVNDIAHRHGVSDDAVRILLAAIQAGDGRQAQFSHPDLGGLGQWSRGGMLMIGDMFNHALKAKVAALCDDVAALLDTGVIEPPQTDESGAPSGRTGGRWPDELGTPGSSGSQNGMHYAVFPETRRLAIETDGKIAVYDTGTHRISGFSQQQGGTRSLRLSSQHGDISLDDLPRVSGAVDRAETPSAPVEQTRDNADTASHADIFAKIEGLAALHAKGILSDADYDARKTALLNRL